MYLENAKQSFSISAGNSSMSTFESLGRKSVFVIIKLYYETENLFSRTIHVQSTYNEYLLNDNEIVTKLMRLLVYQTQVQKIVGVA